MSVFLNGGGNQKPGVGSGGGGWTYVTSKTSSGAKSTATTGFISNPPFDSRTGSRGAVDSTGKFIQSSREKLKRGYIITDKPSSLGKRYLLNFQYNPTSFSHSASLQTDMSALGVDTNGKDVDWASFMASTGQSVDFSLLFDRTYETWIYNKDKPASAQGVLADIKTLYAMLGLYYTSDASGGGGATGDPLSIATLSPTGVLQATPVWVSFGPLMQFYGMIGGVNVTFTHFTQKMTPVRAAVNLSLTVLPRSEDSPTQKATKTINNVFNAASAFDTADYARQRHNDQMLQRSSMKTAWIA
ncbi:hypothetical protein [Terracoccus sp. 273MFTsu3.1]|uniref:hypothetical protein n=1 Tax=Terracoccus sp. 273MFTsu3.1 TaxID=1172188 RepID=UPI00037A8CBD|nr:hypothetical protein [Terracoccus sp. 273MFTsu3.1]